MKFSYSLIIMGQQSEGVLSKLCRRENFYFDIQGKS